MRRTGVALSAALMLLSAAPAGGARPAMRDPVPRLTIDSIRELALPLPAPYAPSADADADVARGRQAARAQRKLLLVDFGADWCIDCRILAGVMARPEFASWLRRHYVVVYVDVGRFERNMTLPARFGRPPIAAVPALYVLDPKAGAVLNPGAELATADSRLMKPQAIADWFGKWIR